MGGKFSGTSPVLSSDDAAWLTGIVEGEGCIVFTGRSFIITVSMTDLDVVERVALMFGDRAVSLHVRTRPGRKPLYSTHVCGMAAVSVAMQIISRLGSRRKARLLECLRKYAKVREEFYCGSPST